MAFKSEHMKMHDVCGCPHNVGKVDYNIPAAIHTFLVNSLGWLCIVLVSHQPTSAFIGWPFLPSWCILSINGINRTLFPYPLPRDLEDALCEERSTWTTLNNLSRARTLAPAYYEMNRWCPMTFLSSSSSTMSLFHSSMFFQCPFLFHLFPLYISPGLK